MAAPREKSVLFVCLGNTCRSPMAERVLCHMLEQKGVLANWTVASAAISDYMVGYQTNPSTNYQLEKNGIQTSDHVAKQMTKKDYEKFHYIFGFDTGNLRDLLLRRPSSNTSIIRLLGDLDPLQDGIIQDPFYVGSDAAFEKVFDQIERCLEVFVRDIVGE